MKGCGAHCIQIVAMRRKLWVEGGVQLQQLLFVGRTRHRSAGNCADNHHAAFVLDHAADDLSHSLLLALEGLQSHELVLDLSSSSIGWIYVT